MPTLMISRRALAALLALALAGCTRPVAVQDASGSGDGVPPAPREAINPDAAKESATIVLAGGCFWCTEHVFQQVKGVTDVVSGYAGGAKEDAVYKKVSMGETDHAEVIQVTYNPREVTLGDLLRVFFLAHDPTTLNRQGPDWGKQYRSSVFYATDEQKAAAEAYIAQLGEAKVYADPIVTILEPLDGFYPAEEYHQDYVIRNPSDAYVVRNALPKIEKLKKHLPDLVKSEEK